MHFLDVDDVRRIVREELALARPELWTATAAGAGGSADAPRGSQPLAGEASGSGEDRSSREDSQEACQVQAGELWVGAEGVILIVTGVGMMKTVDQDDHLCVMYCNDKDRTMNFARPLENFMRVFTRVQ